MSRSWGGCKIGPYVIQRRLGRGATGKVYNAFHSEKNIPVAIKFLADHLAEDEASVTMFEEEANAGMEVNHANVVRTLDVGRIDGVPYIVFEMVNGVSLQSLLQANKAFPEPQALWILRQMGQALRELRRKGIVHQDIKPDNILIESGGNCRMVDLGFARQRKGKINWEGVAAGTAYYMPPEQCRGDGDENIDHRSDLYALGATIYHLATGSPVFDSEDEYDIMRMHMDTPPQPANLRNAKISIPFAKILAKMLAKDPKDRFQTPEELLLEIRQLNVTPQPPVVTGSRFNSD